MKHGSSEDSKSTLGIHTFHAVTYYAHLNSKILFLAAHCLWEKRNRFPLREDKFYVYAGRNSLNLSVVEEGSLMLTPSSIFIHQDWDPNSESFDGDIALIKLNQSLKFSDRIKPIALPPRVQISDGKGFIFGWGKSKDHEVEIFPKLAETRSISAQLCRWQQSNILEAISDRSFCVGGPDKRTPCKGMMKFSLIKGYRDFHLPLVYNFNKFF